MIRRKSRRIGMNLEKKLLFITQRREDAKFKETLLFVTLCGLGGFA